MDAATKKYVDNQKYNLPTASPSVLGGVKVGDNLSINEKNGVLSATDTKVNTYPSSISKFYLTGSTNSGNVIETLAKNTTLYYNGSKNILYTNALIVSSISSDATMQDYIVAQGTCDFWTYRMWASGVAECWGRTDISSVNITTAWGSLYESSNKMYSYFPGGSSSNPFSATIGSTTCTQLFKSTPQYVDISFWVDGSNYNLLGIEKSNGRTALRTEGYVLTRATSGTVIGYKTYYAIGAWK